MAILSPLFSFLKCLVLWLVGLLEVMFTGLFNLLVAGLAALLGPLLGLLPTVSLPTLQLPSFVAAANYFVPLDQMVTALGVIVTVLLSWKLVEIGLRWAKGVA